MILFPSDKMRVIVGDLSRMRVKAVENFKCVCYPPNAGDTAYMYYILINLVFDSLHKSDIFWLASALGEAKAGQGTGSCMLCHLSYFILPFSH